jgi:calcineurin-like phosphoesterase family protein
MIKSLYPPFRRWTEKGTLWIYSDPHFSDPEMPELRENYVCDEEQVRRINSKVGKHDTIIFLGDIGNKEIIRKIRGYKVLIMGNHDSGATNYTDIFDEVYEGPLFIAEKLVLSHEPVELPFAFNIHGHEHRYILRDRHLNVCAEHIDYTPVNLDKEIKQGLLSKTASIHRMTIDRATERKKNPKRDKFLSIKVGDIVWVYDFMWGVIPCEVDALYSCRCGTKDGCTFKMAFSEEDIGTYIFFSREEAEAEWEY